MIGGWIGWVDGWVVGWVVGWIREIGRKGKEGVHVPSFLAASTHNPPPLSPTHPRKHNPPPELEYDPSAYVMYHCLAPEWPCLSFDILADPLGGGRTRYAATRARGGLGLVLSFFIWGGFHLIW